ncbi:MAG: HEAT repeat domain-containing protein [Deltaproteobacteria bacterium]|nr:HEAT repeat domain-containing protein [Deltaproteobacteria bacterium]
MKRYSIVIALLVLIGGAGCGTSKTEETPSSGASKEDRLAKIKAAIDKLGTADEAGLIQALKHDDRRVRKVAAEKIAERNLSSPSVITALIPILADRDRKCRGTAKAALVKIGEQAVEPLIDTLRKDNPLRRLSYTDHDQTHPIRDMIKVTLGDMGEVAVPKLLLALDIDDVSVKLNASGALGRMGAKAKAAVPRLLTALEDKEWGIRLNATGDLSKIAPDDPAVRAAVEKKLTDPQPEVQAEAKRAMDAFAKAAATPAAVPAEPGKAPAEAAKAENAKPETAKPEAKPVAAKAAKPAAKPADKPAAAPKK